MKLNVKHIAFLVSQYSTFITSSQKLSELLKDESIAEEHDFLPVSVTRQAIDQQVKKDEFLTLVDIEQAEYLDNLRELKLAFKKPRIIELTKLYEETLNADFTYWLKQPKSEREDGEPPIAFENQSQRVVALTKILKDIKDEIGDDVNRLAEAMEKGSVIKLGVGELILGNYAQPNDETGITETQEEIH